MKEYRVYYKDKYNKLFKEWFEPAGYTIQEAMETLEYVKETEGVYDVEIRLVDEEEIDE